MFVARCIYLVVPVYENEEPVGSHLVPRYASAGSLARIRGSRQSTLVGRSLDAVQARFILGRRDLGLDA